MFSAKAIALISAAIIATPATSQNSAKDPTENNISIAGKWLPALEHAITEFKKIDKKSLDCYKVSAHIENDKLVVYFYGAPEVFNSGVRGQPDACGKSIIYYLNEKADIVDFEYLR